MSNWTRCARWIPGLLLWLGTSLLTGDAAAQIESPLTLLRADEGGLELLWVAPEYTLTPVEVDGRTFSRLVLPGLPALGTPGQPELPLLSRLIGLPPAGHATLRLVELETETAPLPHPPLPAPEVRATSTGQPGAIPPLGQETRPAPDPAVYDLAALYPPQPAELGPVERMRDQRVTRLVIHPLRVNPAAGTLEVVRRLRLEIRFDAPAPASLRSANAPNGPFEQLLTGSLLNPDAVNWAVPPPPDPATFALTTQEVENWLKIRVDVRQPGLYAISYQRLQQAGWPVDGLDPRTLQLWHGQPRQELAVWVAGESDGRFDPGDQLYFYAEPDFSRYTDEAGYFLSYGQAQGHRMASGSASPAGLPPGVAWRTATAESSKYYDSLYPDHRGDYWYWFELHRAKTATGTFSLPVTAPLSSGPNATLTVHLRGFTDPPLPAGKNYNHRVAVKVNGTGVGEFTWDGALGVSPAFAVPASLLKNGTNQVTVSLPGISGVTIEGAWLDALSLRYAGASGGTGQVRFEGESGAHAYTLGGWPTGDIDLFDVTTPGAPLRLTGFTLAGGTLSLGDSGATPARYLAVPTGQAASPLAVEPALSLPEPVGGADVVIITHPNFANAAAALAAHREAQGVRVFTANVLAIYDAFGSGVIEPAAIRRFLQHAFDTWSPRPQFVVLLGDGSLDFKGYSEFKPVNYIPPYMAHVDPEWGDTAADNLFVTLSGDDDLPEMLIGRLPVNSAAEADAVISKIIGYESSTFPGGWNARHLFVSDNPDLAGNFHADSDAGFASLVAPFVGERFYYTGASVTSSEPYMYNDVPGALRPDFFNQFNRGAGVVTFHGHSSWLNWALEGILNYYWANNPATNDLLSLRNDRRLPLVLGMTCFTSSFHRPEPGTLDEALLRLPGAGAIATWGSTGLGISTGHGALQAGFYDAINNGERNLGVVTQAAKLNLYATGLHQDLLNTFVLLGDPALDLNFEIVPFTDLLYLPVVQK